MLMLRAVWKMRSSSQPAFARSRKLASDAIVLANEDRAQCDISDRLVPALEARRIEARLSFRCGKTRPKHRVEVALARRKVLVEVSYPVIAISVGLAEQIEELLTVDVTRSHAAALHFAQESRGVFGEAVDLTEIDIVVRGVAPPIVRVRAENRIGEPLREKHEEEARARGLHGAAACEEIRHLPEWRVFRPGRIGGEAVDVGPVGRRKMAARKHLVRECRPR